MKKLILIPTLVLALFIAGCSNADPSTSSEVTEVVQDDDHHGEIGEVELDNGEKWKANLETNEGVKKMLALVNEEKSKESPDYLTLKENLDKEFMTVLEKCTMTGESHDQLHNYLLPLKARVDQLQSNSERHEIEDLDDYLLTYQNYFE